MTANAGASFRAGSTFSKTLTIKLEAINFGALASRVWMGARGEVEVGNSSLNLVWSGVLLIDHFAVFEEALKQILRMSLVVEDFLDFFRL